MSVGPEYHFAESYLKKHQQNLDHALQDPEINTIPPKRVQSDLSH